MKKITTTIILYLLAFMYVQAQNVLFVKGGPGSGGFFEGGSDEQLADINNFNTFSGNHGWGTFATTLKDSGYNVSQVIEGSGGNSAVDFTKLNLAQYDVIVLGSNNASYNSTQVNAIEAWVKNGGGLLTISDANFGSDWCDASNSDQSFLDRFGIIVNQDTGTYVLRRNDGDFVDGNHPILQNVNSFDGEGVSPFTLASTIPNGVNVERLVRAKGQIKINNGVSGNNRCEGNRRNSNNNDAALMIATSGNGKVVAHYDRNTFFNNNGAGTNITRFDNERYMLNVFSWLSSSTENNNPPETPPTVSGELKRWHKITIDFEGPNTSETANPNPFSDFRLDVTFTHNGTGKTFVVPGFYSGCLNPAENSCNSGKIWKAHFTPDRTGSWNWSASFKKGSNVAINGGGTSAGFMDGSTGNFNVAESNKSGRDHRAKNKGRTAYVGEHYLRYIGAGGNNANGDWFVKAGADSPENTLAYEDFDSTPSKKSWQPHQQDYDSSDASSYTWSNGKGTELLGVVNYLYKKGVNAFSFLTFSLDGDDKNVSPHVFRDQNNPNWNNVEKDRFDVSKVAQWEKIFEYADKKGMFMHFKTLETENEKLMDGGNLGRERKLYYRELIARFGHHLALNWNLAEESTLSSNIIIEIADYVNQIDPYNHLIALHTGLNGQDSKYTPLLGNKSDVNAGSIQADIDNIHDKVKEWIQKSKNTNRKWVIANDEQGPSGDGVVPDSENRRQDIRKRVLWATLLAGGMGVEYYYGYQTGESDLSAQNHRSRDLSYSDASRALRFFNENLQEELTSMVSQDDVTDDNDDYVFANSGKTYVIYRPKGGSTSLQLPNGNNKYNVQWYNPRVDNSLTAKATLGSNLQAPDNNDWVALITKSSTDEDTTAPTITLTGESTINLTVGDTYAEPGATATDNEDGNLTSDISITGNVDTNTVGTYTVNYNVSDAAGNAADEVSRTILVSEDEDTTAPIITLMGESTINLTVGDTYTEPGATATDNEDGNLTSDISITGNVDTNTAGTYIVNYNVSDAAGNAADEVIRTIEVSNNCTVGASCDDNDAATENDVFDADCNCAGTIITETEQSPYQGTNALIPGKIEAENYDLGGQGVAYNDFSDGNIGKQYRTDNVDIRRIVSREVGYQVGWSLNGEWMEYTANVTAGEYDIELRASSGSSNPGTVKVTLDGVSLGTINIGSTGSYDTFESYFISNVKLAGGSDKVLRLSYEGNDFDIDWIRFSEATNNEDTIAPIITLNGDSAINLNIGNTYVEQGATVWDNVDSYFDLEITGSVDTSTAGTYYIKYNVSDAAGNAADEVIRTVIVSDEPVTQMPIASFSGISQNANLAVGSSIMPVVNASYANGSIVNVKLYINNQFIRQEQVPPYEWGHTSGRDTLLENLDEGAYRLRAEVKDSNGGLTIITLSFTVGGDATSIDDANLLPIHDAFLENDRERYNTDIVRLENNRRVAYLMFDVSRFNGDASNAVLQFKVASDAGNGNVNVYLGTSNDWTENNLNRSNKPGLGKLVGSLDSRYAIGSLIEIPLTDLPTAAGDRLSLILEATDGNDFAFSSKESGVANAPVLRYKLPAQASKYEAIKVYPNPSSDRVTLEKVANENTELLVYDIYGKVVLRKMVSPTTKTIEVSELSTGLYFIFLDGKQRAKFVRE